MRATVPAAALLVATVTNLPMLYLFVRHAAGDVPLIVFAVGALAMGQAWAAGSLIERRREGYRRKLVGFVVLCTLLEMPAAWAAVRAYDVPSTAFVGVPSPIYASAAVVTLAGIVALGTFLAWNGQPASHDP